MAKRKSSLIEEIQYISYRKELYVRLVSGDLYVYFDVPRDLVTAFRRAESMGRYFGEKIKHDFAFEQIEI